MRILKFVMAAVMALSVNVASASASASDKVVIANAQDFISFMDEKSSLSREELSTVSIKDISLQVENLNDFLNDLVSTKIITADQAEEAINDPSGLKLSLESAALPVGNASHRHRHYGYYEMNPVWWIAFLIVISTPAYAY